MNYKFYKTPLSKCLELIIDYRGKTPKKLGLDWSSSGYRAISANNVKFSGLIKTEDINYGSQELYDLWMKTEVQRGDLLLTSEAPSGQIMIWDTDEKIILSQRLYALRVNGNFSNKYLKYYIQSDFGQKEIIKNNSGSTVFGISAKTFDNITIYHPNKENQEKIGNILYALDQKIAINNQINAQLEQMAKTLYDYWFVQFDFPDENGKPYQSNGGEMVYNDTLKRNIPKGWEVKSLGEHITIKRGLSYKSNEIQDTGIPFINLNSFYLDGNFKFEGTKFFTGKTKDDDFVCNGDLLIAVTDVTRNADIIGKAFILPDLFDESVVISCDVAKIYSSELNNFYLEKLFNSFNYHECIKHFASGTLVLHLDVKGISWFETYIPPKDLLDKFEAYCQSIYQRMTMTQKQNQQLTQLRDFLLPMLMNGQVAVNTNA